jgi:hypothetical protein
VKAVEPEMEAMAQGMAVWSLDDRRLGIVCAVNKCCFRFEARETRSKVSVTPEGIFNINAGRISLIYVAQERHRYVCPGHPEDMAQSVPAHTQLRAPSAGWR